MKKVNILLLLLLFAGMQSLAAQNEGENLTVKITPSVKAEGRLSFEGEDQRTGNTITTTGDAEGRLKVSVDYKSMIGGVVEMEGNLNAGTPGTAIGFGDNAYAYIHPLQSFNLGLDKEIFDIYLQGGRFEAGFQNAKHAGDDDWVKDVDALSRDNRINMQLDFKIMNMLTLRYGQSFAPFGGTSYGNDLGFGLLFEKAFGAHKLIASLGYVVDATNNVNANIALKDFDQAAISLAYEGTFGQIVLMPFFNFRYAGLINKPEKLAYENGEAAWSAGLKFQYKDPENKFDIIGAGLDVDGTLERDNYEYKDASKNDATGISDGDKGFTGFQFKVWSDALRSIMGDNYLNVWAKVRLETWEPNKNKLNNGANSITRESIFKSLGIGFKQYFVNQTNASLALYADFTVENIAPFLVKDMGYYSDGYSAATDGDVSIYLDFGLDASFTGVFQK